MACLFSTHINYFLFLLTETEYVSLETFIEIVRDLRRFQDADEEGDFAYAVSDPEDKGRFNIRLLRDALLASNKRISPGEMVEIFRIADPDFDERVKRKGIQLSFAGISLQNVH